LKYKSRNKLLKNPILTLPLQAKSQWDAEHPCPSTDPPSILNRKFNMKRHAGGCEDRVFWRDAYTQAIFGKFILKLLNRQLPCSSYPLIPHRTKYYFNI